MAAIKIKQLKLVKDCRNTAIVKVYGGEFMKNYKFEGENCVTEANKFITKINLDTDFYKQILKETAGQCLGTIKKEKNE